MATWCALQVDTAELRKLKTTPAEFCQRVGEVAFANKSCMLINRLLLVGDDIDVYDWNKVMWAFSTRCRPSHDDHLFEEVRSHPLTPYMSQYPDTPRKGGKLVSDCMMASEYEKPRNFVHVDFESSYPEEVKTKVLANWTKMGL